MLLICSICNINPLNGYNMKFHKISYMLAIPALMLASCSNLNEDVPLEESSEGGTLVQMIVSATRDNDFLTRSELTHDEEANKLSAKWTEGDKLLVTNKEGTKLGYLDLKEGYAGQSKAVFEGNVIINDVEDGGTVDLNYYYLGTATDPQSDVENKGTYEHDYSTQNGTLKYLSDYDILSVEKTVKVVDGKSYIDNIDFKRRVSFARFNLNFPEGVSADSYSITVSGDEMRNKASISLTNNFSTTKGDVVVNTNSNNFYMTFLPTENAADFVFTTIVGGKEYRGTINIDKPVPQGIFFCRKNENTGVFGINVEMQEAKQYRVFYHIKITDIDESDKDGVRICTSLPDIVSGAEAASYRVLNFTGPRLDLNEDIKNEANFTDGYLYEFLGWGTEESAKKSWASDNLGVEYEAKENESDSEPAVNDPIDLTTVQTEEKVENGITYHDLHLYAKGSVMQYKLECVYGDKGQYVAWGAAGKNRLIGWCEIKLTGGVTNPKKEGYELVGWSRKDGSGKLINEDTPIQWGSNVRIYKEDLYGTWDPNYTDKDGLNRPIKGLQTLKLYPVFKEIENADVSLPGYEGKTLE